MSKVWGVDPEDAARLEALTVEDVEAAIGPLDDYAHQCHVASLAIVRSDLFRQARVARGTCVGVGGQHSWVTLGDCYDVRAPILDVTLWSDQDRVPRVWKGQQTDGLHRPHGTGSIYDYGKPASTGDEPVSLAVDPGAAGKAFLEMLGPLDVRGWLTLLHAPVLGWPSREIIAAAYQTPRLRALIPIDLVGMLTDLNPDGLYLKKETADA